MDENGGLREECEEHEAARREIDRMRREHGEMLQVRSFPIEPFSRVIDRIVCAGAAGTAGLEQQAALVSRVLEKAARWHAARP